MNHDEALRLLGAYRDGELDLSTCLKLEEHLADCASCRSRLEEEREWGELVTLETPRFEAPPFLKTRIQASLREDASSDPLPWWQRIGLSRGSFGFAGAAVTLVLVLVIVFSMRQMPALDQEAVENHVRSLQASHLLDVASTDQHTVKPWFAGKLDYSPPVVDLAAIGYPLIGGRLDVLDHRNVAALIYQRRKHYINVFVWPAEAAALPGGFHDRDGYHALGWTEAGMNYLAVSEIGKKEIREFAEAIKEQTQDARPGE